MAAIRAVYRQGVLVPIEPLELPEDAEVEITIGDVELEAAEASFRKGWKEALAGQTRPVSELWEGEDPTTATAGAWKKRLDCQAFERDIYQSRLVRTRPRVRL